MHSARTAMVYPGIDYEPDKESEGLNVGHPAHRGFARAIDAEPVILDLTKLPAPLSHLFVGRLPFGVFSKTPEFPVYVTEFAPSLYAAPSIKRRHPGSTVVHLATHHIMGRANHENSSPTSVKGALWATDRFVEEKVLNWILRTHVDGIIAVSDYIRDGLIGVVGDGVPIEVVNPYIQPDTMDRVSRVEPGLDSKVAMTVCDGREHKGVDMMVDGWAAVRREHPSAEYWIVGENHPEEYNEVDGVRTFGWVDDLTEVMEEASLYVHPARNDGCPVSVLEALAAGIPSVVTTTSGSGAIVGGVDAGLVAEPDTDSLAGKVSEYFDLPVETRTALSEACSETGRTFTEENQTAAFRSAFESLLTDASRSP